MARAAEPPAPAAFDPEALLHALVSNQVRFVVIGGVAGLLWGSPTATYDLDVCYARDVHNLERLAKALRPLDARLRGVDADVPFQLDARALLAGDAFTFTTRLGNLDCIGLPAGSGGFDRLQRTAASVRIDDITVLLASLEDLMSMKRAAGRAKDLAELEVLGALREELERSSKDVT